MGLKIILCTSNTNGTSKLQEGKKPGPARYSYWGLGTGVEGGSNTCYPDANIYAAVSLENIQVLILKVILGKFGRSKFLL